MNVTATAKTFQEVLLPAQHVLRITKLGVKLLISFRVSQKEIPPWLPRHHGKKDSAPSIDRDCGKEVRFEVGGVERDLHSVKHDPMEFFQFFLANAYWDLVETQKGARPAVYFWFHDTMEKLHPDQRLRANADEFFSALVMNTWDYVNVFANPDNSFAIVYKGGSQKPVRHLLSVRQIVANGDEVLDRDNRTWSQVLHEEDEKRSS